MATLEEQDYAEIGESDTETCDSDDSQEDPTFNIEETQSRFSNLSIKKKSKSRIFTEIDEDTEGDPDVVEMIVPELDEKDQKSFESIQKIIEVGQVEKLKVDQCKVYLRKHGLRLTGNKDTLIERIKEHLDIVKSGGEMKYPASSFVVNCKGDACTGDVVMFEQNVYEMFNIASRSASGPPCGTRVVAGRIVKESYGAAKQQHTFTVEVLWSKGEKPLHPLHPLLIKGRNLYRLKTMRQRWEDEAERQKKLTEKHTRGSVARSNREARIQEKEMRKMLKPNRVSRIGNQNGKQEGGKRKTFQSLPISLGNPKRQFDEQKEQKTNQEQDFQQKEFRYSKPTFFPCANVSLERVHQRQPLTSMNCNPHVYEQNINSNPNVLLERVHQRQPLTSVNTPHGYEQNINSNPSKGPFRGQGHEQKKQLCRYYAQGRCYYGDHCKYLHENTVNQNHVQRKERMLAF